MKSFWKTVWASALGFLLVNIALMMFMSVVIGGLVASATPGSKTVTSVPENAVLDIDMSSLVIAEQTSEADPFGSLSIGLSGISAGAGAKALGVLDAVDAIEAAAADPAIKCIYLRPDDASDVSHLEEFREALVNFRKSGKAIYAYIQQPTNYGYYLGSVADRIYMSKYNGGMNMMVGLSGQMMYYKDLLDRLGVNIQLIRHGKYKSAGEPYIRSTASAENLEQQRVMLEGIWKEMVAGMAAKSEKSPEAFNALIDDLKLTGPEAFLQEGLVDELVSMDEMKAKLCTMTGASEYKKVNSISLADYASLTVKPNYKAKDCIAVVYVDGEIVDGRGTEEVAGKRFADIINSVREDEDIKAVVLRVNSPGGSVVAASQIKDAVDALCEEKPVIASYGSYAASGGYWISANCHYIFSDATTLTGSIGVFGIIPDVSKTVKNLAHVNVYNVNTNKHSDMYSMIHTLSAEELDFVQYDIERVYEQFTGLVSEGRNMPVERVDELGQGRVWTGRDGLANGLVDEIGGLKAALQYAAVRAGVTDYCVESFPKPKSRMESLMSSMQPDATDYLVKSFGIPESALKTFKSLSDLGSPVVYARVPYFMEVR